MPITRRVFVSMPADEWLDARQNDLKWAIVEEIEKLGYATEIFFDPRGRSSLAGPKAWNASLADFVTRRCVGVAIIGMPRWSFPAADGVVHLPTEFSHYEGALAHTLGLPMMVLVQTDVMRRCVFSDSYDGYVGDMPPDADRQWLATKDFLVPFGIFQQQLAHRRDLFLGYCGSSEGTARAIKDYLQNKAGATVLDWKTDFFPGRSILDQIAEAGRRCSGGIFLFTKDDRLDDGWFASKERAVPRDNVVFEAGYFINAKGKDHVLIVLEKGAKMPADLGGDIYGLLENKRDITPIEATLQKFVEGL